MGLSALAIKAAKVRAKPYKLTDGNGLYLLIMPSGNRYWRMNYRHSNKQRTLAFGVWPLVGLADARVKCDEARRLLAEGIDPIERKKLDQIEASIAASNTFGLIATEWLEKIEKDGISPVTLKKTRWLITLTNPALTNRPITEISPYELLAVLRKVEARGRLNSAGRLRSTCGQIFRYAIATARASRDISVDLRGALIRPKVQHRAAITDPIEVGALLRAIEGFDGHPATLAALRLLPHLFVRPGELRHAEWSEFNLEKAVWTIPEHKMKMRRPHKVPLSQQALNIIAEIEKTKGCGPLLLPSLRSPFRPMSENTVNAALRRMGYAQDEMTGHGFRAMASTLLNEMGKWNPDAIERQLAHATGNAVRQAYARGEYWNERVAMMQDWSDYLDQLRDGATILTGNFGSR